MLFISILFVIIALYVNFISLLIEWTHQKENFTFLQQQKKALGRKKIFINPKKKNFLVLMASFFQKWGKERGMVGAVRPNEQEQEEWKGGRAGGRRTGN